MCRHVGSFPEGVAQMILLQKAKVRCVWGKTILELFPQTVVQFYYLKLFSKVPQNRNSYFIPFPSTNIKYEVRNIFFLLITENLMDFFPEVL